MQSFQKSVGQSGSPLHRGDQQSAPYAGPGVPSSPSPATRDTLLVVTVAFQAAEGNLSVVPGDRVRVLRSGGPFKVEVALESDPRRVGWLPTSCFKGRGAEAHPAGPSSTAPTVPQHLISKTQRHPPDARITVGWFCQRIYPKGLVTESVGGTEEFYPWFHGVLPRKVRQSPGCDGSAGLAWALFLSLFSFFQTH